MGHEEVTFLRLADGRGWAFDQKPTSSIWGWRLGLGAWFTLRKREIEVERAWYLHVFDGFNGLSNRTRCCLAANSFLGPRATLKGLPRGSPSRRAARRSCCACRCSSSCSRAWCTRRPTFGCWAGPQWPPRRRRRRRSPRSAPSGRRPSRGCTCGCSVRTGCATWTSAPSSGTSRTPTWWCASAPWSGAVEDINKVEGLLFVKPLRKKTPVINDNLDPAPRLIRVL